MGPTCGITLHLLHGVTERLLLRARVKLIHEEQGIETVVRRQDRRPKNGKGTTKAHLLLADREECSARPHDETLEEGLLQRGEQKAVSYGANASDKRH